MKLTKRRYKEEEPKIETMSTLLNYLIQTQATRAFMQNWENTNFHRMLHAQATTQAGDTVTIPTNYFSPATQATTGRNERKNGFHWNYDMAIGGRDGI